MIQMLFSLRFKAQLRRTRGGLVSSLEESLMGAIKASRGNIRVERRFITASFDETAVAFWLDLLMVLETLLKILESAAPELYGHVCVVGKDVSEELLLMLSKALSAGSGGTGIWCAPLVQKGLESYVVFDAPWPWIADNPLVEGYAQIKDTKTFSPAGAEAFPLRGKIQRLLKKGGRGNMVLAGPEFIGKWDGLFRFCLDHMDGFPPLIIRFGSGGRGLSCLADSLNPEIVSLLEDGAVSEGLDALGAVIFRNRLRDEFSAYAVREGERFFHLLLDAYCAAAERRKAPPSLVLRNIHEADSTVRQVFLNVYQVFSGKKGFCVYGTCADEGCLKLWESVFARVIRFSFEEPPVLPAAVNMPGDLWEIAYICELLRPYFPGFLFSQLVEEMGKNHAVITRAFGMLSHFGVIDTSGDFRPRIHGFLDKAEKILGGRREQIRSMVRDRLLDWVLSGKLKTCFNLLSALAELGGEGTDGLILDTLYGDLSGNTYSGIEAAIHKNRFNAVVGANRGPALLYIFRTLRDLMYGDEKEIRQAFQEPYPGETVSPYYQAQIFTNMASYSLSKNDVSAAFGSIKESMYINQNRKKGRGLAHTYRLFSLVNLLKHSLNDALEYFSFAIESAEKSEDFDELAVVAYYAAGTHFLFGNISRAEQLALLAEQTAAGAGRPEWADRSRFLRGRLRFESGRYRNALEIFENLQKNPLGAAGSSLTSVLSAWIYRSHVFLQTPEARPPADMTIDALFFEIEASYLAGNYRRVAELSDQSPGLIPEDRFLFIEQPDWRSGFAQCELFLFPHKVFWERIISTYRALALSRLGLPGGADREQALRLMERILRDEWQQDTDPSDAFYCYAYYQILQEYGAPEVDMNTAISMAFKRLQRRASRIDNPETKRAFLSLHYWNNALGLAARKHKLI